MDYSKVFIQANVKKNYNPEKKNNENDLCPICEYNKVSVMLECGHFFCQNCISTWLFDKQGTCPLCRYQVDLKTVGEDITKKRNWNLIDGLDQNEYGKFVEQRFQETIFHLFLSDENTKN